MHCSVNNLIVLLIVRILICSIIALFPHLKHLAQTVYLCQILLKIRLSCGWNEYVKEHYSIAQDALWWWKFHNKPINGAIYHNMRSSKSRFKYALRAVKRSEEAIRADAMASNLLNNDYDSFWTDVKKLNSSNAIISNLIDGTSGE